MCEGLSLTAIVFQTQHILEIVAFVCYTLTCHSTFSVIMCINAHHSTTYMHSTIRNVLTHFDTDVFKHMNNTSDCYLDNITLDDILSH